MKPTRVHDPGPHGPRPNPPRTGTLVLDPIEPPDPGELLDAELLVDLPPTTELLDRLERVDEAIGALAEAGREAPPHLEADHRHFLHLVDLGMARDEQVAARRQLGPSYAECWCIGLGGRRRVALVVRTGGGEVVSDGRTGFSEICPCPEGDEQRLANEATYQELQQLADAKLTELLLGEAQVPQRYQAASVSGWSEAQLAAGSDMALVDGVIGTLDRWWANVEYNRRHAAAEACLLLMTGDYGEGKTSLAVALLRRWLEYGRSGLMWTSQMLLDEVRSGFGTPEAQRTILGVKRCPFLVIDDLGAEALTDKTAAWAVPMLLEILSHRQSHCLPTVITSNLRPGELGQLLGGRMAERVLTQEISLVANFAGLRNLRGDRW